MPHPQRLPVRQLFLLLDEQLQTPQRDVAAHLGVSKQAVNNWAMGMSLPERYRRAFLGLVDAKIGEALAQAQARSRPTRNLLEMTPLDEASVNIKTALDMWIDELLHDRGAITPLFQAQLKVVKQHAKDLDSAPLETLTQLEAALQQQLRVIRTLKRLDARAHLPLPDRWGNAPGKTDQQERLWLIFLWATREPDGEPDTT